MFTRICKHKIFVAIALLTFGFLAHPCVVEHQEQRVSLPSPDSLQASRQFREESVLQGHSGLRSRIRSF